MIIDVPVLLPSPMKNPKKPPFKYAGSKARMLKKYAASGFLVNEPKMFVDMFAGSTQVAYWIRQLYPDLPIVINDLNDELNQLYHVMEPAEHQFIRNSMLDMAEDGDMDFDKWLTKSAFERVFIGDEPNPSMIQWTMP